MTPTSLRGVISDMPRRVSRSSKRLPGHRFAPPSSGTIPRRGSASYSWRMAPLHTPKRTASQVAGFYAATRSGPMPPPRGRLFHRRVHAFEPRQQHANALMDAAAEPDMTNCLAVDVVIIGALPLARVAVSGTQKHQHLLALAEFDAADLDRSGRRAEERLHRTLISHCFLEGGAGQPRIGP